MRLLIYGSKDFAATVTELVRHCGHVPVGMVDDFNSGPGILGSLADVTRSHPPTEYGIAIAIGYNNIQARWTAWEKVRTVGYRAPVLIHPRAYVADTAQIGDGSMVMTRAIVDVRAELGELTVLWPGACVNHDASLGSNTFISPNATVCGFVMAGADCFVGAGAVITDHIQVPAGAFIKAGSVYHKAHSP